MTPWLILRFHFPTCILFEVYNCVHFLVDDLQLHSKNKIYIETLNETVRFMTTCTDLEQVDFYI